MYRNGPGGHMGYHKGRSNWKNRGITASTGTRNEGDEIVMVEEEGEVWMRQGPMGWGGGGATVRGGEVEQAEEAEIARTWWAWCLCDRKFGADTMTGLLATLRQRVGRRDLEIIDCAGHLTDLSRISMVPVYPAA